MFKRILLDLKALILFLVLSILGTCNLVWAQSTAIDKKAEMHVVIVGIQDFQDPTYENFVLSSRIRETCDSIYSFFKTNFPDTKFHIHNVRQNTTKDALNNLTDSITTFGKKTLTLVFFMSHGQSVTGYQVDHNFPDSDLKVIASNTEGNRVDETAFGINDYYLPTLSKKATPGSIIITFLDMCQSGALKDTWTYLDEFKRRSRNIKLMLVVSTHAKKNAYQTYFTRGLLSFWKKKVSQNQCINTQALADTILNSIQASAIADTINLTPDDARAEVIIDYPGALCLESFASDRGLILFKTNTSSVEDDSPAYSLLFDFPTQVPYERRNSIAKPLLPSSGDIKPYLLKRKKYISVLYSSKNKIIRVDTIDLNKTPFYPIICGIQNIGTISDIFVTGLSWATDIGLPPNTIQELRKKTYTSYIIDGKNEAAEQIAQEILINSPKDDPWRIAYSLKGLDNVKDKFNFLRNKDEINTFAEISTFALQFQRTADFNSAGNLFLKAADQAPSNELAKKFATHAYFSFGAASRPDKAKSIRSKYNLKFSQELENIEYAVLKAEEESNLSKEFINRNVINSLLIPLKVSQDKLSRLAVTL